MCGVCGILYKQRGPDSPAPIGDQLVKMLASLVHRGTDSTGVTIAGEPNSEDLILRLCAEQHTGHQPLFHEVEKRISELGGEVKSRHSVGDYLRLTVNYDGDTLNMAEALVQLGGIKIHSIGECSEVIKEVGTAVSLDERHAISSLTGTHGIGHVRMATESRVDISHAHPFWAYPFPDVTVVHNGQLTNYHKMNRKYEDQGYRFQTENDSELIAVYLADKLAKGATLEEALQDALKELDGTFTFLVSTKDGLGYAKDQWAAKPLVSMETDELVVIASEEVALNRVFSQDIQRVEPQENEIMTWSI